MEALAKYYDIGTLVILGVLALFWILLGVQQRVWTGSDAAPAAEPIPVHAGASGFVSPVQVPEDDVAPAVATAAGPAETDLLPAASPRTRGCHGCAGRSRLR